MLVAAILVPLAGAIVLASVRAFEERSARWFASIVAVLPLMLLGAVWLQFDRQGPLFQHVLDVPWIAAVGAGFRLGVDGISLVVASMSALLFAVCVPFPVDYRGKARRYLAWLLFLESTSLGLFLALDLLVFYVYFDLSLVGMYFLIALWGHEQREQAALQFILYTLAGSLVMLLGVLSLALGSDPVTFDMRVLIERQPLAGTGLRGVLTLLALMFGLAIKTPLVPLHTWLPAAHVEAPAPVSTLLAGVLLKMGTYGMIRVAYAPMQEAFQRQVGWIAGVAVVSIVYGALVALAQQHFKRRIAYTSVTHMGYTVLGIAVAVDASRGSEAARAMAMTGATLEMVAHGLITGALFLIAGSLFRRTRSFDMLALGGVASRAPRLTSFAVIAAFASLGLPGLAGFVAEFQIFAGALAVRPWLAGFALLGVLVTAALFLELLQRVFFGKMTTRVAAIEDVDPLEALALALLVGLTVVVGIAPAFVLEPVHGTTRLLLEMR